MPINTGDIYKYVALNIDWFTYKNWFTMTVMSMLLT